jgi:hypothetical protein
MEEGRIVPAKLTGTRLPCMNDAGWKTAILEGEAGRAGLSLRRRASYSQLRRN